MENTLERPADLGEGSEALARRWPQQQTINELIRRQTRKRMEEA
jgi:hypothetical protein